MITQNILTGYPINDQLLDLTHDELAEKYRTEKNQEWPTPEPITTQLLPVESLKHELIPEPLRDYITDVANRMQCPIDYVAITAIQVISSVVGAGCGVKPKKEDDWLVIPNLWGCIVGRPGMMKTPAVSEIIRILETLETQARNIQVSSINLYNSDIEAYKAKKEAIKSQMISAEKRAIVNDASSDKFPPDHFKKLLSELREPEKPVRRRYKTNDSTIEKLSELLSDNPRGILVYRDELMGFLRTCEKAGHESDRAFFLEAWNGNNAHTSDRISRGTIEVENVCVSIFGTTQPDKLTRYLFNAIYGDNDGLIQRFQLLVYPDEPNNWERIDRKPNKEAKTRTHKIIERLSQMDFLSSGAKKNENERFPYFRFSEKAQNLFYLWWEELERYKLKADEHPILIEHLSKYRKLIPALALLFHLIDLADGMISPEISEKNTEIAIAWSMYLESHARRIYALVTNFDRQAASLLAEKIIQGKLTDGFTVRDIYRQNWSLLNEKAIAQVACDELVEAGWLQSVIQGYNKKTHIYKINPLLINKTEPVLT